MLSDIEQLGTSRDATGKAKVLTDYYEKAIDMTTSPEARQAFDIRAESPQMRERYGYTTIGQSALMARRLIEAGCRFVGIDHGSGMLTSTIYES